MREAPDRMQASTTLRAAGIPVAPTDELLNLLARVAVGLVDADEDRAPEVGISEPPQAPLPRGFEGRFADYDLYDNPFSEVRKAWRIVGGQRLLYSGSTLAGSPASG